MSQPITLRPVGPPPHTAPPGVPLTIDDRQVTVPAGTTILSACASIDVTIPTLCFLETLKPVNVCRLCVVEVEGARVLAPSCSRAVEPGMVVRTRSPRVMLARKLVAQPPKIDNDLYVRDYSKCVLCYKCVEACGPDHQNTFAIAVAGRGFAAGIATEFDVALPDSACVYCGNCIAVCPTGALMASREYDMRRTGAWDESSQTTTDTICPYCGVGCTLTLHVQGGEIVKATSPLDNSITEGNLCIKGRFGWQFVSPARQDR
jgi:predicted molibdopterin-dependent oxidoreductase YjgC